MYKKKEIFVIMLLVMDVKYIKKHIVLYLSVFIMSGFIIDLLTSLTINFQISLGIIIRSAFLFLFVLYNILNYHKDKKNLISIGIIVVYSFIYIIFKHNISDIVYLFKFLYFPLSLITIFNIYKYEKKNVSSFPFIFLLFCYSLIIILATLTKTGFQSYLITKEGTVGWFHSANEIGAILAILLPITINDCLKKINAFNILSLILTIIASFLIGTKVPVISIIICSIYFYIRYIIEVKKNNKFTKKLLIIPLLILLGLITVARFSPMYDNIIIHLEYLNINNIGDLFNFEVFDHFFFGQRLSFLSDLNNAFNNSDITSKLFGLSTIVFTKNSEMDLFDIFYRFGLIGFLSLISIIIIYIKKNYNRFNKKYMLSISLILLISLFAGHVFTSPSVSLLCVIIIANCFNYEKKKNILFASYDLNIGGIENALISLVNNLDKNKYNITIVLEKNKGVLLDKLSNNIYVIEQKVFNNKCILIRKLFNMCNKFKFTISNYHNYDFSCCYATYSLSSNYISRISSINNSIYIHSNYKYVYDNDIDLFKSFFGERSLDKFRKLIFVSNESKKDFIKIYPEYVDKSLVINNLIAHKEIIKLSKENIDLEKMKGKLFVFVGRIEEESKRLTRLIEAFEIVLKKHNEVILWIIGDGKDYHFIENFIKNKKLSNNIKMLGAKKNPYPYMKLADYIVLTSDYEGFPVIYGEAITLNKKIITTIDVTDEIISIPNNFGYIVKKDYIDIAYKINDILINDNLKYKKIDMKKVNENRIKNIEKIIEGD